MTNFNHTSASFVYQQILVVLMLLVSFGKAQAAEISVLYDSVPDYIRIYDTSATVVESIPDDEFYKNSFSIPYVVCVTVFEDSLPQYQQLLKDLPPLLSQDKFRLHSIEIRGGASPEGTLQRNTGLAANRAAFLLRKLHEDLGIDVSKVKVNSVPEDYEYLVRMLEEANDPQKDIIISTIKKYEGNRNGMHDALKRLPNRCWTRMLKTYFPSLRSARVMLKFVKVEEKPIEVPAEPITPVEPVTPPVEVVVEPVDIVVPDVIIPVVTEEERIAEPMLSAKTNLLYDVFWMPRFGWAPVVNIMAEYYPHNSRWSFVAEYEFPWWSRDAKHKYFQILNWTGEVRRYVHKRAVRTGLYFDVYGQYNYWDFSFNKDDGYQGEGAGGGVGIGYVWRLGHNHHWKIEVSGKLGVYISRYDPYHAGEPYKGKYYYDWDGAVSDFVRRNHGWTWFGPTGLGVTISYDLLFRTLKGKKNLFKASEIDPDTMTRE